MKVNDSGNINSNRQQSSNSPFRLINSNSNRNNVLIRESQQSLQNDQEKKQNALENSPQIKQSTAFCTQKTSPRIPNKANIKQQSKLQDIFHLYNINLQNQPFPQYQMQLQQNKYQHRVNVQSSLGSSNYQAQVALNQNFNGNQNVYDPQIQGSPNQQDMQYKQSLEQITESGVESTNPTQANIPFVYADQDKIDKREKVPQNIQQMIIKQQIKTRSTSRKKGRSIASSSLGKQQKLIYLPYAQKPPTTQPSSNRYNQKLNSNNLINNQSQKSNRVVRYQTEINYTDNGNDKSTQNLSCVNTRVKTPDHLHQRKDSMESIVMGQEQVNNTSQVMQTNNSILNSHQNMVTIKSLGGQPQTMDNINSSQVLNQVCSANQSFNTISINQIANSQNNTPQRIRGANKYQNPSIIKFNNINNSNNSLVYQNDQSPIQNYNEGICFNSQTNVFLPSHRSERNETSPISNNNLGGISGSNASCRTPQTQISGMTPINSTKNYYFSLPHSNPQDKPKSALSFYKVKTIQQQDTVRRNQMTMDQFQILDTLGKGSYASVKLAVDKRTNQKIAIKVYEKFKLTDPNKFKNVRREINILSKMTHENIIRLYHVIDTVSSLNLVMEYIGNNSLYNYLRAKRKNQLQMNQIRKIFIQIISGIQYMHNKNVCHRDIKLENILIDDDLNLKIIDFGFAVVSPMERKLDTFCGTPSYMSPEIVLKKDYIGQYVDVWTCGVVLYILICGKFPFKGADEKELYRKISKHQYEIPSFVEKGARSLIQRLLSFIPEDRPACSEILKDKWLTQFDETINVNEQQEAAQLIKQQDEDIILEQKEDSQNMIQKSKDLE